MHVCENKQEKEAMISRGTTERLSLCNYDYKMASRAKEMVQ